MISHLVKRPWLTGLLLVMAASAGLPAQDKGSTDKSGSAGEPMAVDARIAAALQQVSAERILANVEKLVSFGTRVTISPQDSSSIAAGH